MLKTLSLVLLLAGSQINAVIDINGKGINKQALFFGACSKGNIDLVKILLNAGADVNAISNNYTALQLAVKGNHIDIAKLLIAAGADVNAINGGYTTLGYAVAYNRIEAVKLLIVAGVDLNAISNGSTALRLAVQGNYIETVKLLIAAGADTEITNAQGKTAFDVALEMLNLEIIEIFQNYYKEQEAKQLAQANAIGKSVVTIANSSDNSLNILQNTEVPAHSKAVITTEISKI